MIVLGTVVALLLALLPIAVFVVLRSRAERPIWLFALDIPAALAIDLVLTVLVARFVVLDVAAWITKGLWLAAGLAIYLHGRRRGWRIRRPAALTNAVLFQVLAVGLVGLGVSLMMSRPCAIWDRQFHVPLTTSLRGQLTPFHAVYEPWKKLNYHYGADLYAACLQAYSFGMLHASHALSWVHDISFFWFGVGTALVLRQMGLRSTVLNVLVFLVMLLAAPVTPIQGEHRPFFAGYSLVSFLSISFRPYVGMAAMATLPFLAIPLVRLRELERDVPLREIAPPLIACVPLLLIVDEFIVGILGLGLGAVWLLYPRVLAPTRARGALLFAGLAAALVFGIAVMNGTVALGAPRYPLKLVFPRSPGFYSDPLALSTELGLRYFVSDLFPILVLMLGGALLLLRNRDRVHVGTYLVYAVVSGVAVFFFSTLVYNGSGLQNHRFVTVPLLFAPLFVAAWLLPRPGGHARLTGVLEVALVLSVSLSAASGLAYLGEKAPNDCRSGDMSLAFYRTNCRAATGGGLVTEKTRPLYGDPSILYLYAGCRPGFMTGPVSGMDGHDLKVGKARMGIDALKEMHAERRFLRPDAPLTTICDRAPSGDPACAKLTATQGACKPAGTQLLSCSDVARGPRRVGQVVCPAYTRARGASGAGGRRGVATRRAAVILELATVRGQKGWLDQAHAREPALEGGAEHAEAVLHAAAERDRRRVVEVLRRAGDLGDA